MNGPIDDANSINQIAGEKELNPEELLFEEIVIPLDSTHNLHARIAQMDPEVYAEKIGRPIVQALKKFDTEGFFAIALGIVPEDAEKMPDDRYDFLLKPEGFNSLENINFVNTRLVAVAPPPPTERSKKLYELNVLKDKREIRKIENEAVFAELKKKTKEGDVKGYRIPIDVATQLRETYVIDWTGELSWDSHILRRHIAQNVLEMAVLQIDHFGNLSENEIGVVWKFLSDAIAEQEKPMDIGALGDAIKNDLTKQLIQPHGQRRNIVIYSSKTATNAKAPGNEVQRRVQNNSINYLFKIYHTNIERIASAYNDLYNNSTDNFLLIRRKLESMGIIITGDEQQEA